MKPSRGQWILYETGELSMWVWCEAAKASMGMVGDGRGVTVYGVNRSRGQCGSGVKESKGEWVWCETVEGSMVMV